MSLRLPALLFLLCAPVAASATDPAIGAESNPTGNPIGGGSGYSRPVTPAKASFLVSTKEDLLTALAGAKKGDVVYVADRAKIDLTGRFETEIPGGITLASGRGVGRSRGALIYTNGFEEKFLFRTSGPGVRITGLRIRGPDGGTGNKPYTPPPGGGIRSVHKDLEIDNCELSRFPHAAVYLMPGSDGGRIHHNFIHHNRRTGLGYGLTVDQASVQVEANLFDTNRHAIAGTGRPGSSYEASYNVFVSRQANVRRYAHYPIDMHASVADGRVIAGGSIRIHHNSIYYEGYNAGEPIGAIHLGGRPEQGAWIHHNRIAGEEGRLISQRLSRSGPCEAGLCYVLDRFSGFDNVFVYSNEAVRSRRRR